MTAPTVATKVGKTLDVHGNLTTAITFNDVLFLYNLTKSVDIINIQIIAVHGVREIHFIEDLPGRGEPDTVNIGQRSI
jgi:hypothetical protein